MTPQRQLDLLTDAPTRAFSPEAGQLLKWIGNKHRFAPEIVSYFPKYFSVYREPFLGSGAVLGTLATQKGVGSDIFKPLVDIWKTFRNAPDQLKKSYADRWHAVTRGEKIKEYERIKANYNAQPNGPDLVFLSRSCYGGV